MKVQVKSRSKEAHKALLKAAKESEATDIPIEELYDDEEFDPIYKDYYLRLGDVKSVEDSMTEDHCIISMYDGEEFLVISDDNTDKIKEYFSGISELRVREIEEDLLK